MARGRGCQWGTAAAAPHSRVSRSSLAEFRAWDTWVALHRLGGKTGPMVFSNGREVSALTRREGRQ
ncbi:MAG: hypothetical protein OXR67_00510 [Chloroflexota bacterium]|nr:hypothetical protein [Chloroflexota bacterium]